MGGLIARRRMMGAHIPTVTSPRYWVGGTGTWDQSTTTHWATASGGAGGASVPTSANDVIFDANSGTGTVTLSASAPCCSMRATASAIAFAHNGSVTLSIGVDTPGIGNVALDLSGFTSYTAGGGGSSVIQFVATTPTQQTVNYGTATLANQTFNGLNGSWKLLSAMTNKIANTPTLTLAAGSLDTNGQTITMANVTASGTLTRSLTLGASTLNLGSVSNGAFDTTGGASTVAQGLTLSAASSTINLTGSPAGTAALLRGGGLTYGTVNITGTGTALVTGNNTYGTFHRANAAACGLQFTHGSTQTVTTAAGWSVSGASGALITINSDLAASAWTLSCASGTVSSNFLSLQDSAAAGGATFHAGANSTNVSGNSGWLFP